MPTDDPSSYRRDGSLRFSVLGIFEGNSHDINDIYNDDAFVRDCQPVRADPYGHADQPDDHAGSGVRMHKCRRGNNCAE